MPNCLSTQPEDRLGIYKSMSEIPDHRRLSNFTQAYEGEDVWSDYLGHYLTKRGDSEWKRKQASRAIRSWKGHMSTTGQHYALASPEHVEMWSDELLSEYSDGYAYEGYWATIERFYSWLMWHWDHPHLYQPFWLAALEYPASEQMWNLKMASPREGI